jgi:hypothetical protein
MQKNIKKNEASNGTGCFTAVLTLSGIFMAIVGTIGFIFGLFKQNMHIKGMDMGLVDLPTYIGLLIIAIILFGTGYGIDFLKQRKLKKKKQSEIFKMGYFKNSNSDKSEK